MSGVWGVVLVALVVVLGAEATYLPSFKVDHNSRPVWVPPPSPFPVQVPNTHTDCVVQHCQLANTTDDCSKLCNCGWDATANECACTEPDMPACESSYPAPSVTNLQRLARLAPSLFFPNDSISVFGDSITWLNGYLPLIESVFQKAGVPLKVTNRGINGAKIKDLVTGGQGWDPYVNTIQEDNATFVAIYIGINDVWFPSGTYSPPDQFYATLTTMVKQANAFTKNKAVLATVSVIGEAINGGSSYTNQLEVYANLTRAVATATGSPVADLRAEFMAYLNKYNVPFPPHHPNGLDSGILTIDGVHPCHGGCASHSNYLIANSLAGALITAARARAH